MHHTGTQEVLKGNVCTPPPENLLSSFSGGVSDLWAICFLRFKQLAKNGWKYLSKKETLQKGVGFSYFFEKLSNKRAGFPFF